MIRQVNPLEIAPQYTSQLNTAHRSKMLLYVSMMTTLLALLLMGAGGLMVYHSMAASEAGLGLPGIQPPDDYVVMALTATLVAEEPSTVIPLVPTEEPEAAEILPSATVEIIAIEPISAPAAATEIAMAATDDNATPVATGISEQIEDAPTGVTLELTEDPTVKTTPWPSSTVTPKATATPTTEDTATPTETTTATATRKPTSSATATDTATPEDTATPTTR